MKECLYRYKIRYNLISSNINSGIDYCFHLNKIKGGDMDGKKRFFRNHNGNLNVPCSNQDGSSFNRNGNWVSNDWDSNDRFLVLDTIFISIDQLLIDGFLFPCISNLTELFEVFAYIHVLFLSHTIYLKEYE